jgi:hypothetical protein
MVEVECPQPAGARDQDRKSHPPAGGRGGGGTVEPFVVAMAIAMVVATAALTRMGWQHLRARQIAPSDSPILVD